MSEPTSDIRLVRRIGPGVLVLQFEGDQALWTRARLRGSKRCELTGKTLPAGTEAYRPVGNQQYRMRRIGAADLDEIVDLMEANPELGKDD